MDKGTEAGRLCFQRAIQNNYDKNILFYKNYSRGQSIILGSYTPDSNKPTNQNSTPTPPTTTNPTPHKKKKKRQLYSPLSEFFNITHNSQLKSSLLEVNMSNASKASSCL